MQEKSTGQVPVIDVGKNLRQLRLEQHLSIRSLAKKSGLNVNTLSMIENGKTSPSVATLQQLAYSLGKPITSFFEDGTPKKQIAYHKAEERRFAEFTNGTMQDLSEGMLRRGAEPFLVELEPLANSGESPIVHTGREFVYCLEGQLSYTIEDQTFVLMSGDSLLFEAHLPHRWQNTGATHSRSLLVLCPTDEKDDPTEQHFALDEAGK